MCIIEYSTPPRRCISILLFSLWGQVPRIPVPCWPQRSAEESLGRDQVTGSCWLWCWELGPMTSPVTYGVLRVKSYDWGFPARKKGLPQKRWMVFCSGESD